MLKNKYALAMKSQALYGLLCIVWNAVVIWQLQVGAQPIGPTGSTVVIMGAVVLVMLLAYALHKSWESVYLLLAAVVSTVAFSAVWSSVNNSNDAWPSAFWQAAGLSINILGVTSFFIVVMLYTRGRRDIGSL